MAITTVPQVPSKSKTIKLDWLKQSCVILFAILSLRSPAKYPLGRNSKRAMSLIEVLITIAIIGLISSAAAVGVNHIWISAKKDAAEQNAGNIRSLAHLWRQQKNSSECPDTATLIKDKIMDKASKANDPWGNPYKIVCADEDISVFSFGNDKREATDDDIWVPSKS